MKIVKAGDGSDQQTPKPTGKTGKGSSFAKKLEAKRKVPPTPVTGGNAMGGAQTSLLATAKAETNASATPSSIQHLANEIVDHMHSQTVGDVKQVDIQFKSQTLAGLGVQVQSVRGVVSVNFVTQVDSVASLLNRNLDGLRSVLESKGVRVSGLGVSGPGTSVAMGAVNRNRPTA